MSGIGDILGLTIMLETGDISRFPSVGDFASYCHCMGSERLSNGQRKGRGNTKHGNKYLAWAFVEAANFAVCYNAQIKRYDLHIVLRRAFGAVSGPYPADAQPAAVRVAVRSVPAAGSRKPLPTARRHNRVWNS